LGGGESDIDPPWRQWHRMRVERRGEPGEPPTAEQPQLSKPLKVKASPVQDTEQRVEIEVFIFPDGTIGGGWTGEFFINKDVDYQVMNCQFKSVIDSKQVYTDRQGEDASKLFFIAKGHFVILETNNDTGRVRSLTGDAYVRGWLGTDYIANGQIVITSDEKDFFLFTWHGPAEEVDPFSFEPL